MTDTPTPSGVHGTPNPSPHVHPGIKGFMTTDTAGMPNWVWLIVIVGGVAAAYFIPKLIGSKTSSSTTGANTSGLGLAIDPTTGLPYAVEGLVPSGGVSGSGGSGTITPNPPPPVPGPPPLPDPNPNPPPPSQTHLPGTTFLGPTGVNHYVSTGTQTLSQIAQMLGLQSWNSLYAIPENQQLFGNPMNAHDAANYKPPANMAVVIPGNVTGPPWPGQ